MVPIFSDRNLYFKSFIDRAQFDRIQAFDTALETRFFVNTGSGTENEDFGINECVFSW